MMGVGFVWVIALLGAVRELIGQGTLFSGIEMIFPTLSGVQVLPESYPGFLIAILPPGAFFVLGLLIAGRNWLDARANQRLREQRLHDQPPRRRPGMSPKKVREFFARLAPRRTRNRKANSNTPRPSSCWWPWCFPRRPPTRA
jgi:hypothetical protein